MHIHQYQLTKQKERRKKWWAKVLFFLCAFPTLFVSIVFSQHVYADETLPNAGSQNQIVVEGNTNVGEEKPILLAATCTETDPTKQAECLKKEEEAKLIKEASAKYQLPEDVVKAIVQFVQGLNYLMTTFYMLLLPLIVIAGKLLSNDWVMGGYLNIDLMVEMVWQIIRNMVNIFIVFYLLYMAGVNIAGVNIWGGNIKGQVDIKKQLPWVALALVVVNFSLFFCRQVINISNITTGIAFSFPATVSENLINTKIDTMFGYNPFVWAQPIPKDMIASDKSLGTMGAAGSNNTLVAAKSDAYVVECLHRNYALNLNGSQNKLPLIVPNPPFDSNEKMTAAPQWYYRLFFYSTLGEKSSQMKLKTKIVDDTVKAAQTSYDSRLGAGSSTPTAVQYPYYSDCILTWDELAFSARNAMFAYAFNIMRIQDFQTVLSTTKFFEDIVTKNMLAVVMLVFFLLVNIALVLALVIRSVYIWIMLALSPLWVVTTVMKIKMGGDLGKQMAKYGPGTFVKLAFMPTAVGMVLSIGFMMLNYIKYMGTIDGGAVGRIPLGTINFLYDASTPLLGGLTNVIDMMIALMGIGVLWMGVFAAMKVGMGDIKAFTDWVEPINKFGSDIGKSVVSMPTKLPLVPIPGKGMFSLQDFKGGLTDAANAAEQWRAPKSGALANAFGFGRGDGEKGTLTSEQEKSLKTKMKDSTSAKGVLTDLAQTAKSTGSTMPEADMLKLLQMMEARNGQKYTQGTKATLDLANMKGVEISAESLNQLIDAIQQMDGKQRVELKEKIGSKQSFSDLSADQKDMLHTWMKEKLGVEEDLLGAGAAGDKKPVEVVISTDSINKLKAGNMTQADFRLELNKLKESYKTAPEEKQKEAVNKFYSNLGRTENLKLKDWLDTTTNTRKMGEFDKTKAIAETLKYMKGETSIF